MSIICLVLLAALVPGMCTQTYVPCKKDHGCMFVSETKKVVNTATGVTYCCFDNEAGPQYNDLSYDLSKFTCVCYTARV